MINDIQEDYCGFEVSKLLRDKGFDVHCNSYFEKDASLHQFVGNYNSVDQKAYLPHYSRPTHALAIKWIRENFGIIISINPFINGSQMDNDIPEDEPVERMWTYYIHKNRKFVKDEVDHSSPEQATEAALLYTLQNLIL